MDVITAADLASYLRDPSLEDDLAQIVALTNGLIAEEWSSPGRPRPGEGADPRADCGCEGVGAEPEPRAPRVRDPDAGRREPHGALSVVVGLGVGLPDRRGAADAERWRGTGSVRLVKPGDVA